MSDSADSDFDGFDNVVGVADGDNGAIGSVDFGSDSDISSVLSDDLSSDSDNENVGGGGDADTSRPFTAALTDVNVVGFREPTGPAHRLGADASEVDFFMLLFTSAIIQHIVDETNRYAEQSQAARQLQDVAWSPTTTVEMKAFIGINILMGFHELPEIDSYWSSDEMLGVPAVAKVMTKSRFKKLCQYLHCNDNTIAVRRGEAGHDPLHKIRPVIEAVSETFARRYRPDRDLAIDEAMVGFKGRCFMKQYLPAKPVKWGFKVWTVAESKSGYVCAFDVYTGRRAAPTRNGLGYDVVMQLTERYQHQWRHLYFDNFFSSIKLLRDLQERQTYACATVRANRVGLPLAIRKPARMQRGESVKLQSGSLVAVVWRDKRDVRVISTNCDPVDGVVQRRDGAVAVPVACPLSIVRYNQCMGGVDLADQQRSYYGVGRESKKFWKYILWHLVNTAIINSYIIYTQSLTHPLTHSQHNMTHLRYRLKIVRQLVGGFTSRRRAGRKVVDAPVIEAGNLAGHDLVKSAKKLVCRNCSQLGKATPQGRGVATTWKCRACDVPLCRSGCLVAYHTRHASR